MKRKRKVFVTQAAMIAALYVVLTLIANMFGLANYAIQVRFSEALTILPVFTPTAIPGFIQTSPVLLGLCFLLFGFMTNPIVGYKKHFSLPKVKSA